MTDNTATKRARTADAAEREVLAALVERLRAPLFSVAYRELGHYDNAQDAVANALLRVIKYLPRLRDPAQVQAWAARIVRNEARRLRRPQEAWLPDDWEGVGNNTPPSLLRLDVERELRRLPRDQARASALFYFEGYGIAQIARELHRPEGTVKYWLHQTRGRLRATLEGEYGMETEDSTAQSDREAVAASPTWAAVIVGEDFAPATVPQVEQALRGAGWEEVHHVSDALTLGGKQDGHLLPPLAGCRLIVLGEQAGGRSAFELSASWRASREGKHIALILIADGNRPEAEFANTAMAAYVAGFDFLLSRPFNLLEMESFARRVRTSLEAAAE